MGHRVLVLAALAVFGGSPLLADAAEQTAPLRTLTYAVDVSVADTLDTPGGAINTALGRAMPATRARGAARAAMGSGDKRRHVSRSGKGVVTVEVVSATDDAGLIADVSETAGDVARPKVRIAVAGDGGLFYDTADVGKLTEEEIAVAHWLARRFFGDHPTEIGTAWTVDQSANGHTDVEHYRVVGRREQQVTLDYVLEERNAVSRGFAGTRAGSLVYDIAMVVPVKAVFETTARRQVGDSTDTLRTTVKITLTADSFARPS